MKATSILAMMFFVTACSKTGPTEADKAAKKSPSDDVGGQSEDALDEQKIPDGEGESDNAGGDSGDSDDGADSAEGDDGGANDVGKCRVFSDKYDSTTAISGPVTAPLIGKVNIDVKADAKLAIKSTASKASISIDGRVTQASPALAKTTAQGGLDAYRDPLKMELTENQNEIPGWEDLDCMFIGVTRLSNNKFDFEFDPALPMLTSPDAAGKPINKTIKDIKATVKRHYLEGNGAKKGTYTGTAKITGSNGTYKMDFDFGSGVPKVFAVPFGAIEYVVDGNGGFSKVTTWIWVTGQDRLPVELTK